MWRKGGTESKDRTKDEETMASRQSGRVLGRVGDCRGCQCSEIARQIRTCYSLSQSRWNRVAATKVEVVARSEGCETFRINSRSRRGAEIACGASTNVSCLCYIAALRQPTFKTTRHRSASRYNENGVAKESNAFIIWIYQSSRSDCRWLKDLYGQDDWNAFTWLSLQ